MIFLGRPARQSAPVGKMPSWLYLAPITWQTEESFTLKNELIFLCKIMFLKLILKDLNILYWYEFTCAIMHVKSKTNLGVGSRDQ